MAKVSNAKINIVRAVPMQAGRLSQIAHAAKSYWGYPAHWIELWHNQLTIGPGFISSSEVWAAECEGTLQGFYSFVGTVPKLTMDNMWVMPVSIGQGIGSALFNHAMRRARELGAEVIEIESDPNAEGFYQKMGALTVGEVGYTLDGMLRTLPLMQIQIPVPVPAV